MKKLAVLLIILVLLLGGCEGTKAGQICRNLGYPKLYVDGNASPSIYYCVDTPKAGEVGRILRLPDNLDDINVLDWMLEPSQ